MRGKAFTLKEQLARLAQILPITGHMQDITGRKLHARLRQERTFLVAIDCHDRGTGMRAQHKLIE
jgi:hypothetical protein